MENFKSFGRKLNIPFFQGFTAITGPNGSGKSNIIDAILFVLGPRSSKVMRAGRLTDLIFNGGKKHKNPAKYCKVSLVFDNKERKMPIDADEVCLTRMIKRAPLKDNPDNYYSYFYINDRSASYNEFLNVLTHARISGEGYNIVKQGDITYIVEMGSVDRRRIIDDIAGISSFDEDIKKAEKEKNDAEVNLERINIILNEISNQIKQLKKERDEAYRYKELKDKLYETKAMIAYKKKQEILGQIAEIQRQIESYESERKKIERQRDQLKKQYDETQKKLEEIEKEIANAGGENTKDIKDKIQELRAEEVKTEEKINYESEESNQLKKDKKELTMLLDNINKEIEGLQKQHDELSKRIESEQSRYNEKEKKLNELKETIAQSDDKSMEINKELLKIKMEYTEKQNQLHEFKLNQERLIEKIKSIDHQISELQETKSTYEFELKDATWQENESKKEKDELNKKLREAERKLVEKKKKESEITEELSNLDLEIRRLQREQAKMQAEREALESLQGGYSQAINAILSARDKRELKGIHGTVSELAEVDEKYSAALEAAAGPRIHSIVVDTDETAAQAIEYLRKKNLGRAAFLPLNKMITGKPRGNALLAVKDPASHGFAIDLVRFKPEYRPAFWYVFGDTVVVETLSDARRLMGGVRLVDLKGSLIEASGAMIGGSRPDRSALFGSGSKTRFDEVTKQLLESMDKQEKLSKELLELRKEIKNLEDSIHDFKNEIERLTQSQGFEAKKKEFTKKLEILNKEIDEKNKEKQRVESEKNNLDKEIEECNKRLEELNRLKDEKGQHLLRGTRKELAQGTRVLEEEVNNLHENLLKLKSESETLLKKIELTNERRNEVSTRIQSLDKQMEDYKKSIEKAKAKRMSIQNELKTLINVEEQMNSKVKELATRRDKVFKESVSIENDLDKINTKMESYNDLITRAQYRIPTLEEAAKEIEQELALYHIEIKDTGNLPSIESLKETVRSIEETMQGLEPVNMRALEEYEHQMERKKKFDEDVKHLQEQKRNLTKLVEEITAKKKERFFEVFNEINNNFKLMYAQLSEGGEAELILEDEEHIFESGLTIKARPRGKKILRLEALSGGEKSIASLAFIFAIQQYDPSPFYVLDEVDMFLDGVNAEIISRMIKRNSEHSQFITVSLRKVLLKEADYIYGVTMTEDGVSQMIGNISPESVGPKGELLEERMIHA